MKKTIVRRKGVGINQIMNSEQGWYDGIYSLIEKIMGESMSKDCLRRIRGVYFKPRGINEDEI